MVGSIDLTQRTSESQKKIGRSVSLNGVHAVDVKLNQAQNLQDPIVDLNIKVNNPIGRLWLALKRIWKSQNTIISLRFTIPLLVLPIALYVGWLLWQGRAASTTRSLLGIIHEVSIESRGRDVLILPTSDVILLTYPTNFDQHTRLNEKPVIVAGMYSSRNNELRVDSIIPYSQLDLPAQAQSLPRSSTVWDTIWDFITQFK